MKKVFFYFTLFLLFSCSKNEPVIEKITITADKTELTADSKDVVTFKVTTLNGSDVTAKSVLQVNGAHITGNTFSTNQAGEYSVKAVYSDATSNVLKVTAKAVIALSPVIKLSKTTLVSDNVDLIELSCVNENETSNDLTKNTVFFVDGKEITGNVFKTSTSAEYTITAKYKTTDVVAVKIVAKTQFTSIPKVFAEQFTGTWCPYCPRCITIIEDAAKDSRIVPLAMHVGDDPFDTNEGRTMVGKLSITGFPTIVIDRVKEQKFSTGGTSTVLNYLKSTAKAGIVIESKINGTNIEANVHVSSAENMPDVNCVVILAENKLHADQANAVYSGKGNPIRNMEHNHVFRASYNAQTLGEKISLTAGNSFSKLYTFPTSACSNAVNAEIIVLITNQDNTVVNAQKVLVGKSIGY